MDLESSQPRGGLFQHEEFVYRDLVGCPIERFVGYLDESARHPVVLFLKAAGGFWQRFYIDAGLGFWGEYSDEEIGEELADETVVDYGERFGLAGELLGEVRCEPIPRLRLGLTSGEIVVETADRWALDAPMTMPYFRAASWRARSSEHGPDERS